MRKLFLILPVLLAACSSTPKSDIAALETGLTAAGSIVVQYEGLPRCVVGKPNPPLCSDQATVAKAAAAFDTAYTAVKSAESIAANVNASSSVIANAVTAAQTALNALISIIQTLKVS